MFQATVENGVNASDYFAQTAGGIETQQETWLGDK